MTEVSRPEGGTANQAESSSGEPRRTESPEGPPPTGSLATGRATASRPGSETERWVGLALCAAMLLGWAVEHLVPDRPTYAQIFAPDGLPLVAALFAVAGLMPLEGSPQGLRAQRALRWSGLLLLVWAANGLPLDVLRAAGLIPLGVDWPGLATRAAALAAALVLARLSLARTAALGSARPATWYGYAAFAFALPYPVLRTIWALGGTLGLMWPGAAGQGFEPWLLSIPWVVAAGLSLFLVSPPHWMPRRLLLLGGWCGTAVVAMIGPAACWARVSAWASGGDTGFVGIEIWVPALFYGSWLLWAIAAAAATRSYQLRSAALQMTTPTEPST